MYMTTTGSLTVEDLKSRRFKRAEITRLVALRERYNPYRELCASDLEFERLAFLKWRYERGEVNDG